MIDHNIVPLATLAELSAFVLNTLCERDRLDVNQVKMRRAPVRRGDRTCGVFFQIVGPRMLRTYAIWASDDHRIFFYDSTGERFADVMLSDAPDVYSLAA